jgi:AraC-like DNA-binding protein
MSTAESSHVWLGIRERKDDVLFCAQHPGLRDEPGYMQSQLYQLQVYLSLIRHFAGPDWVPTEIGIEHAPESSIMIEQLPDCRVRREQPTGYVAVSRTHLHKAARRTDSENGDSGDQALTGALAYDDVLRALLKPYLSEGYPTMRLAADLMDTSPRTLARRLSAQGLGYRALVDEVRFTAAKERLCQPHVRISEVAWSVGFREQTHFTRMFRRIGGVTPGQMRRAALRAQA